MATSPRTDYTDRITQPGGANHSITSDMEGSTMKETAKSSNGVYNVVTAGFGHVNRVRKVAPNGTGLTSLAK